MQTSITPVTFLQALSEQFPDAIGVVPVNQGAHHGAVVAFDFVEAQTKTCSIGVQVNNLTIIGTPTLSTISSVFRISLERLSILRPDELTPLLRQTLSQYGKVLHVGLSLDPATKLFFGKGYAMIDTAQTDGSNFRELVHEMHLDNHRIIMASWRGMKTYYFYYHKPGYTRQQCPKLEARRVKPCYTCGGSDHLFRNCPKRATEPVGDNRTRTDHIEPQPVGKPKLPTPVKFMDSLPSTNEKTQEAQHGPKATEKDTEDASNSDYAPSESDKDFGDEKMYSENSGKDNMDLDKNEIYNLLWESDDPSGQSNSTQSL
ncbi:unnamed protein product [Rhizopus stolonifer]